MGNSAIILCRICKLLDQLTHDRYQVFSVLVQQLNIMSLRDHHNFEVTQENLETYMGQFSITIFFIFSP